MPSYDHDEIFSERWPASRRHGPAPWPWYDRDPIIETEDQYRTVSKVRNYLTAAFNDMTKSEMFTEFDRFQVRCVINRLGGQWKMYRVRTGARVKASWKS